ncbi:hypothetical protein KKG63_02575 [Patescibacteria group bacterium]|nr:hypothetical protein [Patescibacteria group bacterium]
MKKFVIIGVVLVAGVIGLFLNLNPKSRNQDLPDVAYGEDGPIKELEAIKIPNTPANKICQQLPFAGHKNYGERYRCLAIVNQDKRFCEGLDEEKEKSICLALVEKDPSYCDQLTDPEPKHVCYYQLAVTSEDASFCSEIDYSQHEKEQCYMNFVTNLYFWGRADEIKTEYCNQLGVPDRYTCQALQKGDVMQCGNNPHCLTFFPQDSSFCQGTGSQLDDCVRDRAMTSKDASICEQLTGEKRDDCLGDFCTHIDLDINICNRITNVQMKQERYVELAIKLANDQ